MSKLEDLTSKIAQEFLPEQGLKGKKQALNHRQNHTVSL